MKKQNQVLERMSLEKIEEGYRQCEDRRETLRWQAVLLVAQGRTVKQASQITGYSYENAKRIVARFIESGAIGLVDGRKDNRRNLPSRSMLTEEQKESLVDALSGPPPDGGLWTGPKVARWIAKETGRDFVHPQRGHDYLRRLGFRVRRPRRRHVKANADEQAKFKEELPKVLKEVEEENPDAKVELWAFDEHRIGLHPLIMRVWVPKGQTPIAHVHPRNEWVYLYAFVHPESGDNFWLILPTVNYDLMSMALQEFATCLGVGKDRQIVLVLDRAGWHTTGDLTIPEGIHLHFLPPYSPELQPAERLWNLSDQVVANQAPASIDDLEEKLAERCRYLRTQREEVSNLTLFHWWPTAA